MKEFKLRAHKVGCDPRTGSSWVAVAGNGWLDSDDVEWMWLVEWVSLRVDAIVSDADYTELLADRRLGPRVKWDGPLPSHPPGCAGYLVWVKGGDTWDRWSNTPEGMLDLAAELTKKDDGVLMWEQIG